MHKQVKVWTLIALALGLLTGHVRSDNRIVVYLKHAPRELIKSIESSPEAATLFKQTPGQQATALLQAQVPGLLKPGLGGVAAVYGGYFNISSKDGLISFPLRHTPQKLYVAITPLIHLVRVKGNTFSHRSYAAEPTPVALYALEMKKDEKQRTYWEVKKEALPKDRIINPLTLVLMTPPANVIIPEGEFLATENPQLILPDIMLISREGNDECLLKAMDLRQYFESITVETKKASETSTQHMIKNI